MTMIWIAVAVLSLLGLAFGLILGYASRRFKVEEDPIVDKIDDILPQSQCGQCGFPGCRPYAESVANGGAINRCAPGGEQVMLKLADMLGVDPQPLDGDESVLNPVRKVAFIHEDQCIGCTKCIQACRWMRLSVPPAPCTLWLKISARGVICVSHPARQIALR